jgi:hypothetical protein
MPGVLEVHPRKVLREDFNLVLVVDLPNEERFVRDDLINGVSDGPVSYFLPRMSSYSDLATKGMIKATQGNEL